jgi:hypothetical protein
LKRSDSGGIFFLILGTLENQSFSNQRLKNKTDTYLDRAHKAEQEDVRINFKKSSIYKYIRS